MWRIDGLISDYEEDFDNSSDDEDYEPLTDNECSEEAVLIEQ